MENLQVISGKPTVKSTKKIKKVLSKIYKRAIETAAPAEVGSWQRSRMSFDL